MGYTRFKSQKTTIFTNICYVKNTWQNQIKICSLKLIYPITRVIGCPKINLTLFHVTSIDVKIVPMSFLFILQVFYVFLLRLYPFKLCCFKLIYHILPWSPVKITLKINFTLFHGPINNVKIIPMSYFWIKIVHMF